MKTRAVAAVALCAVLAATACGKKGPPLAPFVRIPAQVEGIAAERVGNEVFVTITVPAANIDGSRPVDINRIDIYGYTGAAAPPRERWLEFGALVATIPVAPPSLASPAGASEPPAAPSTNPGPGAVTTIHDVLEAADLVQGRVDVDPRAVAPAAATATPQPLKRFYLAIPFNTRGVPGPPGPTTEVILVRLPDRPQDLNATYNERAVTLTWSAPGGLAGFLIDRALPPEPPPVDVLDPVAQNQPAASVPPGPLTFNVYREFASDPLAPPLPDPAARSGRAPIPLNPAPLAGFSFSDEVAFGRLRCYRVRAVRGTPPVLSEPSEPFCMTPVDVFPPAAPSGLTAIASEGAINLLWEPNNEPDLRGYLVLRRAVGDDTLQLLTDAPIVETRFRDAMVAPGMRYVYSVVAVDNRLPLPNLSSESVTAEESAR